MQAPLPLQESVLERPNNIWQVTGGRSKGGILVREKCEKLGWKDAPEVRFRAGKMCGLKCELLVC